MGRAAAAAALLPLLLVLAVVIGGAVARRAYPYPSTQCSGMEDYRAAPPRIRSATESGHRYLHRPWSNTGLGHAMEVYNLVLRLALHNNLTFVHTPLNLGHGPFAVEPELYFQFGRHPDEALPALKASVLSDAAHPHTELHFPPVSVNYKSHRGEAEPKFAAFARQHAAPYTWFEVPTPMVMADQDSDWSETGAWYRAKFEAARQDRAFAKAHGLNTRIRVRYFEPTAVNVAVHVRRGDALMMGSGPAQDDFYVGTVNDLLTVLRAELDRDGVTGTRVHVHVFTDASKDRPGPLRYINEKGHDSDLESRISCDGCVFMHLGGDAMETFHHFVHADVLVQSVSMFSNTAAVVSRNVKVFSQWNRSIQSLPNTVAAHPTNGGLMDDTARARFRTLWRAYAACNGKRWKRAAATASPAAAAAAAAAAQAAAAATPKRPPAPVKATPPPPTPSNAAAASKPRLTAEELEEIHRRAHDDL